MLKRLTLCLVLTVSGCGTQDFQLLEAGHSTPDTLYLAKHIDELKGMTPHTGMKLDIHSPRDTADTLAITKWADRANVRVFLTSKLTEESVAAGIKDMKQAGSDRFRHNYVGITTYTKPDRGGMDFFDDDWWDTILYNTRLLARAAKEGGCKGLVFDGEQYAGVVMWDYEKLVASKIMVGHSKAESIIKAKQRGHDFAAAICEEFPGATVWTFFAYSYIVNTKVHDDYKDRRGAYDLYGAFLDGMLEGSDDDFILVDGQESSYGYTTKAELEKGARTIRVDALKYTTVDPALYRKKVRVGFGFYIDASAYMGYNWNRIHPEKNYFTPGRLQRVVYHAFRVGDGYVWTWSEKPSWWVNGLYGKPHAPAHLRESQAGVAQAYKDALKASFTSPGTDKTVPKLFEPDPAEARFVRFPELRPAKGTSLDAPTKMPDSLQIIKQLPTDGWRFRTDPYMRGELEKWHLPGADDSEKPWQDFKVGQFIERQGIDYDGQMWYRREIDMPTLPAGKKVYLFFGAVDEAVHCYINGKLVAYHDGDANEIWNMPFALEVTGELKSSDRVTLVFKVLDRFRLGGIWKPVWLAVEK
jgi:hypothetical protein